MTQNVAMLERLLSLCYLEDNTLLKTQSLKTKKSKTHTRVKITVVSLDTRPIIMSSFPSTSEAEVAEQN